MTSSRYSFGYNKWNVVAGGAPVGAIVLIDGGPRRYGDNPHNTAYKWAYDIWNDETLHVCIICITTMHLLHYRYTFIAVQLFIYHITGIHLFYRQNHKDNLTWVSALTHQMEKGNQEEDLQASVDRQVVRVH